MICGSPDWIRTSFADRDVARVNYEDYLCRKTLSAILNGRAGISPEMAVRLSLAFDTSSESWLNQQVQHDLWQAERSRRKLRVRRRVAA
jgi:antitoxin HigA-1